MKTTIGTRLCCCRPLIDLFQKTLMFRTFILQYLNKLVEGEVRDFTSPQAFHAVKAQSFNDNRIKFLTEFGSKLPMKVFALIAYLPIKACELSHTTPPPVRTFCLRLNALLRDRSFFKLVLRGCGCCIFSPVESVKYAFFIPKSAPTL